MSSGLVELFPPLARFLLVVLLVSFLPGELIRSAFFDEKSRSPERRLPLSFLLGLSFYAVVTWLCWVLSMPFSTYVGVIQITSFIVFGVALVGALSRSRPAVDAPEAHAHRSRAVLLYSFAFAVACFYYVVPHSIGHDGDAFDHLGYIRSIAREDALAPAGVLAMPAASGASTVGEDPRKGSLHPILAAVVKLAGVEPLQVWRWLPLLLAPVAVLAFIGFAQTLLPNLAYVLFCIVLFLMFQGGLGRNFLGTAAYGQHLSMVFLWTFFVHVLEQLKSSRSRRLTGLMLLVLGGGFLHFDVLIHVALLCLSLLFFCRWFNVDFGSALRLTVASALVGAVVLSWKIITSYGDGNALHLHPHGLLYFFDIGDRWFIPSPVEVLRKNGLLFFVGIVALPGLFFLRTHRRYARMMLALSIPPMVIAMNPFLAPLVFGKATYLLHRFLLNIPALTVTALLVGATIGWARRGRLRHKAVAAVVLFLWIKVAWIGIGVWASDVRSIGDARSRRVAPKLSGVIDFISRGVPEGAVLLSDPVTSYTVSALSDIRIVTTLNQHGNPNDPAGVRRLSLGRNALSPYGTPREAVQTLETFNVDYVLLNGSARRPIREYMADWDPRMLPVLRAKFASMELKPVYDEAGVVLYVVTGRSASDGSFDWFPVVPFLRGPDDVERCERADVTRAIQVTGMKVLTPQALPGEEVRVVVAYRKNRQRATHLPPKLHLRFEDSEFFDSAGVYPGNKYVRRFRERQTAVFYRFRIDHTPFDGLYTTDLWPIGQEIFEEITIRLPTDLRQTTYEIQYTLTDDPLIANFSLRDLLFNDDSFVGPVCGEIEVTGFRTE